MTFEEYKSTYRIYRPVTTHPEKFWAAVPKDSIDPSVDTITASTKDTIDWILEVNYKSEIKARQKAAERAEK